MRETIESTVKIEVNISWSETAHRYIWTYTADEVPNPSTGNFTLPRSGRTEIIYELDKDSKESYQLIYVNLDPSICATAQIEEVYIDHENQRVTIIDCNDSDETFSLRLVARVKDDVESGFISADPQVTNHPT